MNRRIAEVLKHMLVVCLATLFALPSFAGGPLAVGGPNFGIDGQPFTWDTTSPIAYRVDGGPLSQRAGNVIVDNATGLSRVQAMFNHWAALRVAFLA